MARKSVLLTAVSCSPFCLSLAAWVVPKIAFILLGVGFLAIPVPAVVVGALFLAAGLLQSVDNPLANVVAA